MLKSRSPLNWAGLTLLLLALTMPASAATIYTAVLDGPTANTPSPATGTATLTLNDAETEVRYEIQFSELVGIEQMSHFHASLRGMDGPILTTLAVGSPKVGTWEVGPYEVGELQAGRVYINVHTDLYAVGEIRGNVVFSSVANEAVAWSAVKALYR